MAGFGSALTAAKMGGPEMPIISFWRCRGCPYREACIALDDDCVYDVGSDPED